MPTTLNLKSTTLATGVHAFTTTTEREMSTGTAASVNVSLLVPATSSAGFVWTSLSGVPNLADLPSGSYKAVFDVSQANSDLSYGVKTAGTVAGHFAVVDSGLTVDNQTATQAEALFTLTGVKTATVTWDPAAGSTGDRFEVVLAVTSVGTMGNTMIIVGNTGTSYAEIPDAAATDGPPPFPLRIIRLPA